MSQIGGSDIETEYAGLSPWTEQAPPIGEREYYERLDRARALTQEAGADALLVGAGASLRYFAGVGWGATERLVALLVPVSGDPVFICPHFELGSLDAERVIAGDVRMWQEDESPAELIRQTCAALRIKRLAIDPAMAFGFAERIRKADESLAVSDATPIIDGCRSCKSSAEIALMQQAKSMTLEVHRRAARILQPGIRESEVKRFIDQAHRALGASGSSFCAVQFGEASAYPHGLPGDRALAEGDLVLIDTGCLVQGYNSDITRTYTFGEPTPEQARLWQLERDAQQAAFDAVKPGVACEVPDQAAREVLEEAGLGPDYELPGLPHRTGHGVGLAIHEAPYLVRGDTTELAPGMCFSNEPMIVVPGRFGIRLEDHFYVTQSGAQWFTPPSPAIDRPFA